MSTIWFVSKYVSPPSYAKISVGTRGFLLVREFARAGHQAHVITSDSNHQADPPKLDGPVMTKDVDGVSVHWLRTRKFQDPRSLDRILSWFDFEWRLWRMPKRALPKPDVVIVSSLSPLTIFNGLLLRWRYRCKLVFEVRDIWPLVLVIAGGYDWKHPAVRFLGWVERLAYRRADLIVGTMPNLKEHVIEVSGSVKPVICVPQGLDETICEKPQALPEGFSESYIASEKFIVCHAGMIGADNALSTFLECARQMRDRSDIQFLLVGEGNFKSRYQAEYADLPNITFAPGVPKPAVQSVLERVDLVYFSVHRSPLMRFGQSLNKVIDYMYSGKPVLASFTGYPSMINEADCGTFVPAEDVAALRAEIDRYVRMSAEDRARIGARGREWLLKHRGFETLARDYMSHIQRLINEK